MLISYGMPDREPTGDGNAPGSSGNPSAEDLQDHPGRPRGDEIDPELVRLPRPRSRIGWLLALSVVVLCGYVMLQLRADLVFSRQGTAATALATAQDVLSADLDSFVTVQATPDRAYAARVLKSRSSIGQRLFPLLGTDGRVWLLVSGSPWREPATYDERWEGRVRELDRMPFSRALNDYLERVQPMPRFVDVATVRAALASGASQLRHASGDTIAVTPDTEVRISQRIADRARITATATEEYPDEAAWRAALERSGVLPPGTPPESGDEMSWRFGVTDPGGPDAVNARLIAAGLRAAHAEDVITERTARWSKLSVSERGLAVDGDVVPWNEVREIGVSARRTVPAGARVLVATERPADYWYLLPLFGVLSAFALLFGWAFARSVRSERANADAASATASAA